MLLIALCWVLWAVSVWPRPDQARGLLRRFAGPIVLVSLALLWGVVQVLPFVPPSWAHPIWTLAASALGHPLRGTISLDPWESGTVLMKLGAYAMTAWLACVLTQRTDRAIRLLNALIAIGAFYALYALVLGFSGIVQFELFYPGPPVGSSLSGPFVLHNSFATYMGMAALCSCVRLFTLGRSVVVDRGFKPLLLSTLEYVFSTGMLPALALILTFSMLVASYSRAGFLATLVGMTILLALSSAITSKRAVGSWRLAGIVVLVGVGFALFVLNGDTLQERFANLIEEGGPDQIRLTLWAAALRMIGDSPWLGLGLGTFENAYPLYADHVYPFVMDKAHNDYLELAAGWGLPATLWLGALFWLTALCVRGVFRRNRNRSFPLLAVGATGLVAFHSAFDFSLQIPAVAVTYAVILGLGIGQSFSTRSS